MTTDDKNTMTVADHIVLVHDKVRTRHQWIVIGIATFCTLCAFLLVWKGVKGDFTFITEYKGFKAYFSSLVPGLAFLLCGTLIMCMGIWKKFKVRTQHKDDSHPGMTEAED